MLSYGFTYAFRLGVFSVFCNNGSAITLYATPHPRFECLHEGTCKLEGSKTDRRREVGPNFVPTLHQGKTRNSSTKNWRIYLFLYYHNYYYHNYYH